MSAPVTRPRSRTSASWTPWRTVVAFGMVSLAGDMVYEGMRSVAGPFLASLGASALAVGLITGAGEAMALILRLFSGPYADRSGRYWSLTILGYAMTAVCVPLLAVTPFVGSLGLALAATLILLERAGKAIRSPSKSALLARSLSRSAAAAGSPCTRRWTRSGRSPARCWSPGVIAAGRRRPGRRSRCWPCPGRCACCCCSPCNATPTRRSDRDRHGRRPGCRPRPAR